MSLIMKRLRFPRSPGRIAAAVMLAIASGMPAGSALAQSSTGEEIAGSVLGEGRRYVVPDDPIITVNESVYFVVGSDGGDTTARFQFSFEYRIFSTEDDPMPHGMGWLAPLHFGYTQTSLWNLSKDSAPFEDSSYRPSFYWELAHHGAASGLEPDFLRFGYEHESNGKDGAVSRSLDTLFILPAWQTRVAGRTLTVAPKIYGYIETGEFNRDIESFRGYEDYTVRYGEDNGWLAQLMYR